MTLRTLIIACAGSSLAAPGSLARSGPGDDRDTTIDALKKEIAELRTTVADLKAAQEAAAQSDGERWLNQSRAAEIKALVADAVADADSRASLLQNGMTAGYDKGFFLRSADGNWSLNVKGQIQLRYTWNNARDQGTLTPPEPDNLYGFEVRRLKITLSGTVVDPSWEYEVKLANNPSGNMIIDNAWIQKSFEGNFAIRAGQFKLPFLLEESTADPRQLGIDRSYVNELYKQDYSKAIQGSWAGDDFRAWAAYSDGFASRNTVWNAATANDVTGRVEWKAFGEWKQFSDMTSFPGSQNALMLGGAVNWQENKYGPKTQRLGWTVDASWKSDGWNVFAYVTGNSVDPATGASADQLGAVIQAGCFLSDTWEIYGRCEWSDLDGASPTGAALPSSNDLVSMITAGVTWYIDKLNLKWQNDIGVGFEPVPLDQNGIGWRQDAVGVDGQVVVRSQFQLLF